MVSGKRWWCLVAGLAFFAGLCPRVWAQGQNPGVAVLPFVVHGQKEVQKTRKTVEEMLVRQLKADGVKVTDPQEVEKSVRGSEPVQTEEQARAVGRKLQTEYALMGSYNEVGNSISLDARLVDVSGRKKTEVMFAEEKGVENLAAAIDTIVKRLSVPLLSKAVIADVKVRGNDRIESEAIKANVKSRKGEVLRPDQVREDIRSVYKMGFFEKVDADVTDTPAGKELTFVVQENPSVQEVKIKGNKKIKEKDILSAISTKPHTVLQQNVVSDDVQKILKLYQQKAYYNAEVKSSVTYPKDPRRAVVTYDIKENKKVYIRKVDFTGNKHISSRKLRGVMQSKKANMLSFFTERGVFQRDVLDTDVDRLAIYYHDRGFMDVKVGKPTVDLRKDGFYITIPVEEGDRYKVSGVKMSGDTLDEAKKKPEKSLKTKQGEYFSREKLRGDIDLLRKAYMNEGYAHVDVNPDIQKDTASLNAAVDYKVAKKELVYIGKISVSGNTKTRDYVIRRELKLAEGELFSSKKLEDSLTSLKKLDYFEDVEIVPVEGSQIGVMDLNVKVKEKLTGTISVGGGYSSEDGLFASGTVEQRNLWGKGHYLGLKGYLGTSASRYMLSYTDPWIFGYHVAAGGDLYNWERDYGDFTKKSVGGRLRMAFPFGEYSRLNTIYTLENDKATDIPDNASEYLKSMSGERLKSSITVGAERDTTDHPFMPNKGSVHSLSFEVTNKFMGSDLDFLRLEAHSGVYIPLFWKFVGFVRGEVGTMIETDKSNPVPIYEHFFLGGINSLRAWSWGDVGPKIGDEVVGGLSYTVFNVELLFPLIEKLNMRGVVFFDAGNAYEDTWQFDMSDLRTDAGLGIRWQSPFGPLRIEWGYNLDRRPGEDKYKWQFSAGAFF
ncbi:MAG: outer membrane protein assembly factor BamA [Syntrophobacteraceae bacterium]|nr:outer membrane protein assembly factor BamA [Desulfobacteraceae bacterium]